MCCGAMFWAGVGKVVYAASQADITRVLGAPALPISSREVLAQANPPVAVEGPLLGAQAVAHADGQARCLRACLSATRLCTHRLRTRTFAAAHLCT